MTICRAVNSLSECRWDIWYIASVLFFAIGEATRNGPLRTLYICWQNGVQRAAIFLPEKPEGIF